MLQDFKTFFIFYVSATILLSFQDRLPFALIGTNTKIQINIKSDQNITVIVNLIDRLFQINKKIK
jgi:hypothetical protein